MELSASPRSAARYMRKRWISGGPDGLDERAFDGDLDDRVAGIVMLAILQRRRLLFHPPLDQQFEIDRAGGVLAEAISEGMVEAFDIERLSTSRVRPVEKRAVLTIGLHSFRLRPMDGGLGVIGRMGWRT